MSGPMHSNQFHASPANGVTAPKLALTGTLGLRPREAARALGIGERLLWEMTKSREIPHVRIGRAVVYPVTLLERWLQSRCEPTTAGVAANSGERPLPPGNTPGTLVP
jgi:excisionase family DNA binding protein